MSRLLQITMWRSVLLFRNYNTANWRLEHVITSGGSEQHRFVLGWGKGRKGRGEKTKVHRLAALTRVFKISRAISLLSLLNPQTAGPLYRGFSRDSKRLLAGNCSFHRVIIIRVVTLPRMVQNGDIAWRSCLSDSTLYHLGIRVFFFIPGWWYWMALGNHLFITHQLSRQLCSEAALPLPESHTASTRRVQSTPATEGKRYLEIQEEIDYAY